MTVVWSDGMLLRVEDAPKTRYEASHALIVRVGRELTRLDVDEVAELHESIGEWLEEARG